MEVWRRPRWDNQSTDLQAEALVGGYQASLSAVADRGPADCGELDLLHPSLLGIPQALQACHRWCIRFDHLLIIFMA